MARRKKKSHYTKRRADGYRSGLEAALGGQLEGQTPFEYETIKVRYTQPAKSRLYQPDFILPNGIVVEAKGKFESGDRMKHLFIRDCWPGLDIRFVFSNPRTRIRKGSKTTYAKWCVSKDFLYANAHIPIEWIKEAPIEPSLTALEEIRALPINNK